MKKSIDNVTYLLEMRDGTQKKITIPSTWVITFGALIPGSQQNGGKLGLRIRKGQQQMAVFQNVESFRNTAINIEERVTTTKEETFFKGDGENRKVVVVEGKVHEWINPDHPRPQSQAALSDLRVVDLD